MLASGELEIALKPFMNVEYVCTDTLHHLNQQILISSALLCAPPDVVLDLFQPRE
jgi:hypothetical protein